MASSTNAQKFYHLPMHRVTTWRFPAELPCIHGITLLPYNNFDAYRVYTALVKFLYKNLDGHGVYIAALKFSSLLARRSNFCTVGLVPCDRNTGSG